MLARLKTLLIVDRQRAFLRSISRAAVRYDFQVHECEEPESATILIEELSPGYAVFDLGKNQQENLRLVEKLLKADANCKCIATSAHANIAAAVSSIRAGAIDYIPKPMAADRLFSALLGHSARESPELRPMNPDRLHWEYLHYVLKANGYNVSRTATKLKMHRRSLQRILNKNAPVE